MAFKFDISKGEEYLLKFAALGAAALGIVSVYNFYKNNIWHPKIEVKNIDYKNGVANLLINGKPFVLKGDSSYLIENDWGIKFGFTPTPSGVRNYDRIEVLKRGMVHQVIHKSDDASIMSFTGFDEKTFWNDAFEGGKGSLVAVPRNFTGSEEAIVNNVWGVKDGEGFSLFKDK